MNEPADMPNCRILVVDDNPSIHEDFRKILCPQRSQSSAAVASLVADFFGEAPRQRTLMHFEMDSASQGQEGYEKIQRAELEKRPYSLAFMDVRMPPGWDGIETIKKIWAEFPQIQIVVCTAYSDYSFDDILRQLGETDNLVILKKPFDNVEVLQLAYALTKKWAVTRKANLRMAELDERVGKRTKELLNANAQLEDEIERRTKMEAALRESEERFHKAFEAVPVALSIQTADSEAYLDVNQSFVNLCGYGKNELLGKAPAAVGIFEKPEEYAEILRSVQNNEPVRNFDLQIRRKDGKIRHTLTSAESLALGSKTCTLMALQDVTDYKRLESELRQSQKMEAVGQLAAGVAHDFNNLLTIIRGYSALLLEVTALDKEVAEASTEIADATERAAALTRQLLAFGRRQIVQPVALDIRASLMRIKDMLRRTIGETILLEWYLEPNLPFIFADQSSMDQIIINLILNARDAMPKGGTIRVSAELVTVSEAEAFGHHERSPGTYIVLSVSDTGVGIAPENLDRIFEPFYTTKPPGQGTGLGLSTVYGIAKQHQGWVEVQTKRSVGTTFRVFLPPKDSQPSPK